MSQREVTIGSRVGLHARPAAMFVRAATESGAPVRIGKEGGKMVDARSMLGVLSIGAKNGETVILQVDDEWPAEVLDSLAALLAQDLDEPVPTDA